MEALDVVSSRENALDREAAFRSGDDAVDSSIGADVGPLDFSSMPPALSLQRSMMSAFLQEASLSRNVANFTGS